MPAGPSLQASAATTRVSTQLQNLESEVKYLLKRATASEEAERCWREVVNILKEMEKELRSQLAAEEKARLEADILRRKCDKKVARLKAKIRLMFESNGSDGGRVSCHSEPLPAVTDGAEQQQQHGDVDAHGADGEEAGIVEEADLVGQPADVYTDMKLSQNALQRLINLSSSKWDADMEKVMRTLLPYGNVMIKWP
eukprot:jgi/Tetstr1/461006/TSEL_006156.t1